MGYSDSFGTYAYTTFFNDSRVLPKPQVSRAIALAAVDIVPWPPCEGYRGAVKDEAGAYQHSDYCSEMTQESHGRALTMSAITSPNFCAYLEGH